MRASIVIASWQRAAALKRCLMAISQLQGAEFEVIVVADQIGLDALEVLPFCGSIKRVQANKPNISIARNLGIKKAAGDVVAFIDDDAVPEPSWLKHLLTPFSEPDIAAAGGFVRGRNGISWQWRGRRVDRYGYTQPHEPSDPLPEGWYIKTEGTNMAVRRNALGALGGFDPAYAYLLDETDLNLRMAHQDMRTVLVPDAEVHHGYMAGPRRRGDRVPRDLYDEGQSWAIFLRKFAEEHAISSRLAEIREEARRRLMDFMVRGLLEPRDIRRLLNRLELGVAAGLAVPISPLPSLASDRAVFAAFPSRKRASKLLTCRPLTAKKVRNAAREMVRNGDIVTVLNFSSTALFHHLRYTDDGYWEQTGGVFGKSLRSQNLFCFWKRNNRYKNEVDRVQNVRLLSAT